jgi:hypothetical protein
MQTDRPTHPSRWRLKKAAPNPEAAKTHSLRVRPTKAQARHLFGPSRGGSIRLHDCNARTCCFDGERRALTSHSVSIFGCNALTFRFAAMRGRFTPYDVSVMVLPSAISINPRQATLPDVSLPRAAGGAALSSNPAFHRLGFFLSRSRPPLDQVLDRMRMVRLANLAQIAGPASARAALIFW